MIGLAIGFILIGLCLGWALCKVGGESDEWMETAMERIREEERKAA